jgi:hypothetical protein
LVPLIALAGIAVLAAWWTVYSAPVVLSTEMTWDLLFNLAGAWHLQSGHVPHVDFHEPVGVLTFVLTNIGLQVAGASPRALLVGVGIVTALVFAFATFAAGEGRGAELHTSPVAAFMSCGAPSVSPP